jgi:hypothetical protein
MFTLGSGEGHLDIAKIWISKFHLVLPVEAVILRTTSTT